MSEHLQAVRAAPEINCSQNALNLQKGCLRIVSKKRRIRFSFPTNIYKSDKFTDI